MCKGKTAFVNKLLTFIPPNTFLLYNSLLLWWRLWLGTSEREKKKSDCQRSPVLFRVRTKRRKITPSDPLSMSRTVQMGRQSVPNCKLLTHLDLSVLTQNKRKHSMAWLYFHRWLTRHPLTGNVALFGSTVLDSDHGRILKIFTQIGEQRAATQTHEFLQR